jgi:hypothetical protein
MKMKTFLEKRRKSDTLVKIKQKPKKRKNAA